MLLLFRRLPPMSRSRNKSLPQRPKLSRLPVPLRVAGFFYASVSPVVSSSYTLMSVSQAFSTAISSL
jgi:hypothetical protein